MGGVTTEIAYPPEWECVQHRFRQAVALGTVVSANLGEQGAGNHMIAQDDV